MANCSLPRLVGGGMAALERDKEQAWFARLPVRPGWPFA